MIRIYKKKHYVLHFLDQVFNINSCLGEQKNALESALEVSKGDLQVDDILVLIIVHEPFLRNVNSTSRLYVGFGVCDIFQGPLHNIALQDNLLSTFNVWLVHEDRSNNFTTRV